MNSGSRTSLKERVSTPLRCPFYGQKCSQIHPIDHLVTPQLHTLTPRKARPQDWETLDYTTELCIKWLTVTVVLH